MGSLPIRGEKEGLKEGAFCPQACESRQAECSSGLISSSSTYFLPREQFLVEAFMARSVLEHPLVF